LGHTCACFDFEIALHCDEIFENFSKISTPVSIAGNFVILLHSKKIISSIRKVIVLYLDIRLDFQSERQLCLRFDQLALNLYLERNVLTDHGKEKKFI